MFARAASELEQKLMVTGLCHALLQTLSNHALRAAGEELPVAPVTGFIQHLAAMRYSELGAG